MHSRYILRIRRCLSAFTLDRSREAYFPNSNTTPGTLFRKYLTRLVMIGKSVPMSEVKRITNKADTLNPTLSMGRVSSQ
jgi:hypothetical protein